MIISNMKYRALSLLFTLMGISSVYAQKNNKAPIINLVFTSDAHYGLTRDYFRGDTAVSAARVNAAMIQQINLLPAYVLPAGQGIAAGEKIGAVDYLVQTGDISNRMDAPIQSAAASWAQFESGYLNGLKLKGHNGQNTSFLIVPGNHDISNAIGTAKPMKPLTDPTTMVKIYNLMMRPAKPMTNQAYNYANNKINYSRDIKGIHMVFLTLWPDSAERVWMQKDLEKVARTTPVIIFTHDQPECQDKHFTNPIPPHNMTLENKFENLTAEYYKEGTNAGRGSTDIEQRGLVKFLKAHPNIKAYFHGNSNWNEFYTYTGPDHDISLPVFRVDSPMKGKFSAADETKLSFQLISIDTKNQTLTARECLWNTNPTDKGQRVVFGKTATIPLKIN